MAPTGEDETAEDVPGRDQFISSLTQFAEDRG